MRTRLLPDISGLLYDNQTFMEDKVAAINKSMSQMSRQVDQISVGTMCRTSDLVSYTTTECQAVEEKEETEEEPEPDPKHPKGKR